MPNNLDFTFSDLVAGYVISADPEHGRFEMNTSDGRPFVVQLTPTTTAEMLRNLGDAYVDATAQLIGMLEHGRLLHVYGLFYPSDSESGTAFEAKHVLLFGKAADEH